VLSCRAVIERANAQLDGESGFRERRGIGQHLRTCPACRRYLAQLRTTIERVRARDWAIANETSETRAIAAFGARSGGDD
jgi:anti-sigma factor RsiW